MAKKKKTVVVKPYTYDDYKVVNVARKGENVSYACPADPVGIFRCGACSNNSTVGRERGWRCKCGARVVLAIPAWWGDIRPRHQL